MSQLMITTGRCQFCHAKPADGEGVVAGDSAFICADCVARAVELISNSESGARQDRRDRYVSHRLAQHLAPLPPTEVLTTSRTFPQRQQADLQLALDDLFGERIVPDNFVGIQNFGRHEAVTFTRLLERDRSSIEVAPPQFEEVDIGRGEVVRCLKNGVWFLRDGDVAYVVVLGFQEDYQGGGQVLVEIATPPGVDGAKLSTRVFNTLELRLSKNSCYRGRVLSLEQPYRWAGSAQRIRVHELEPVAREDVILSEPTLKAVERNILLFAAQRAALRDMGISTQKGLLFHGPPGTGKTHCIRYLSGQLNDHTTLLITAEQAGLLSTYMSLARLLQPALVVIEDADLIARDRDDAGSACDEVMLNQLLNELDGLREKADVFFVLTTNRPESLEGALASRPGRIDQAIEFALPDESLRRRLLVLYARTLNLPDVLFDELAKRTEGSSPAFIKELMRRVAQHHLEAGGRGEVARATAESALHEMLFSGGVLNTRLLGGGTRKTQ
jgi:hypothetical protein